MGFLLLGYWTLLLLLVVAAVLVMIFVLSFMVYLLYCAIGRLREKVKGSCPV